MKEEKVYFENSKKQKLCGIIYIPDGDGPFPFLVVCHGFTSSKESSNTRMTYPELIKNKIGIFAFDFSGHGESEGKIENTTISQAIDDLDSALKYIENKDFINKNKIGLLGSSFGGLVSTFVTTKNNRIKTLALKTPIIDYKLTFEKIYNIEEWRNKGFVYSDYPKLSKIKLNYILYQDGAKYNALDVVKKIKIPTLVIVGDKDKRIFSEKVKEFFDLLDCEKEFHWIKGAKHWFSDENKKEIFRYINNWFKKWLR